MGLPIGFGPGDGGLPPDGGPPVGVDPNVILAVVLGWLGTVVNWVKNIFSSLIKALVNIFTALQKFLLHIWQNYVKRAIQWLASHVQKIRAWLKRTIGPIIARLEKIKKWYDQHILKQQLRMLQFLQSVRRFLGILRIFHVKWAAKLDSSLADLQNRIEQSISIVRGNLNGIINWLNAITNPIWLAGLLHKGGFVIRSLDALLRSAHLGGLSNWGAQSDPTGYGSQSSGNVTGITEAMHQDTATGTGKFNEFTTAGKATWNYLDNGWR
jgi:hypothetical protein